MPPTKTICCDWSASGFLIIDDADYDPATHRLYDEEAPAGTDVGADAADAGGGAGAEAEDRPARRRKG